MQTIDAFVHGELGFTCFRIPSVVLATSTSTLFAFAEARNYSGDDCYPDNAPGHECFHNSSAPSCIGPRSLALKTSKDSGATWSSVTIVDWNGANPAAVYDALADQIVVHYVTPGQKGQRGHYPSVGGNNSKQLLCSSAGACNTPTSLDPWLVWRGAFYPLGQKANTPIHVAPGPGLGVQLARSPHTGRLVFSGHSGQVILVWYSDDHARSWTLSNATFGSNDRSPGVPGGAAGCDRPEGCFDEPFAIELADGTLQLNARNDSSACDPAMCCAFGCDYLPTPCCSQPGGCAEQPMSHPRTVADSRDGGASFGPAHQLLDLREPTRGCQASSVVAGQDVFYSAPAGATAMRTNLTVRRSADGGATYPHTTEVWGGPGGYSCLTRLPAAPGSAAPRVGVAFERGVGGWAGGCWGGGCRISFARVSMTASVHLRTYVL